MKLENFDPETTGSSENGLFGIPTDLKTSALTLIPVPWEVTTSYGGGASLGPKTILDASPQLDLYDLDFKDVWRQGFHWIEQDNELLHQNNHLKKLAQDVISHLEKHGEHSEQSQKHLDEINQGCKKMVWSVYNQSEQLLADGKIVGVVGGDHSSPEGLMQAVLDKYENEPVGILHIDAHHDLRKAYQGFEHSHASIMYNILRHHNSPSHLVQLGIRDFSELEFQMAREDSRIFTFWDRDVKSRLAQGGSWHQICQEVLQSLPEKVYVSFDIDGLSPEFCPHTGTPVPGGLSYNEALYLLKTLGQSGKQIVGFDLNEVAPSPSQMDDWDGNVGARILFQLCGWATYSKK